MSHSTHLWLVLFELSGQLHEHDTSEIALLKSLIPDTRLFLHCYFTLNFSTYSMGANVSVCTMGALCGRPVTMVGST